MSRTRLSGLLAIPLLSASLLLGATPALALGTLDQSQTSIAEDIGTRAPDTYAGQTFVAGITGLLDTVEIVPSTGFGNPDLDGIAVSIEGVIDDYPDGNVLASSTIHSSVVGSFVAVSFADPAQVRAGTAYTIVIGPGASAGLSVGTSDDDVYPGGRALIKNESIGIAWSPYIYDLAFKTYVTTYGFAWKSPTKGKGHGVNKPQAGTTVAVTFRLDSARNKSTVIAPGWPKVRRVNCSTKNPIAGTEWHTRPFGASGLTRSGTDYTYAWHVRPEWGNGPLACREFRIKLTDGTTHSALYRFQPAD